MGWLITAIILVFLGALPIGVYGVYNPSNSGLYVLIGPARIRIGKTEEKTKKIKKRNESFSSHKTMKKKKSSANVTQYLSLLRPVLRFLTDFRTKLRVDNLHLKVVLAGGDPCDLSINYGRAWIALGNIMPHIERYFVIKKRNLEIECDYIGEKTSVDFSISLTITLIRLVQIVIYHGIIILCEYFKILKKAKDGAVL